MNSVKRYLEEESVQDEVRAVLKKQGVAIIPTDTIYGFSAVLSSRKGYERILKLKKCKTGRNFLLLASSIEMVKEYIDSWGSASEEELSGIWPAPLTAILPVGAGCPGWAKESIAFRVPAYEPLLELIADLGEPLISTSVNVSGESPLHRFDEILKRYGKKVDIVVASRRDSQDLPSTIVDFTLSEPCLLRQGSYPW